SKAYVKQLAVGKPYDLLEPVYGVGIVNAKIFPEKEQFYHHYKVINVEDSEDIIEDLEFILVELEKDIKLKGLTKLQHKQLAVLWLRFLKETRGDRTIGASELSQHAELQKAVSICEVGGYTDAELFLYERNSDAISTEKTLQNETRREALEEGRIEGRVEGEKKKETEFILNAYQNGISIEQIAKIVQLPVENVTKILRQNGINT
ncbi:MAG: Rpn family recombination-promoting nuclease/putative transposase, partial [Bacteroidales bacterium]|nr:Rpn family recombination-promoting nuclease/putative transposase [Bacteroidales bacterium]